MKLCMYQDMRQVMKTYDVIINGIVFYMMKEENSAFIGGVLNG